MNILFFLGFKSSMVSRKKKHIVSCNFKDLSLISRILSCWVPTHVAPPRSSARCSVLSCKMRLDSGSCMIWGWFKTVNAKELTIWLGEPISSHTSDDLGYQLGPRLLTKIDILLILLFVFTAIDGSMMLNTCISIHQKVPKNLPDRMIGPSPAQFGVCFDLLVLGYWEIQFSISSHVSFILRNVRIVSMGFTFGVRWAFMTIFLELFEKSWGIPSRHRLVVSVLKWSNDWMIWGYTTIFGNPLIRHL